MCDDDDIELETPGWPLRHEMAAIMDGRMGRKKKPAPGEHEFVNEYMGVPVPPEEEEDG